MGGAERARQKGPLTIRLHQRDGHPGCGGRIADHATHVHTARPQIVGQEAAVVVLPDAAHECYRLPQMRQTGGHVGGGSPGDPQRRWSPDRAAALRQRSHPHDHIHERVTDADNPRLHGGTHPVTLSSDLRPPTSSSNASTSPRGASTPRVAS